MFPSQWRIPGGTAAVITCTQLNKRGGWAQAKPRKVLLQVYYASHRQCSITVCWEHRQGQAGGRICHGAGCWFPRRNFSHCANTFVVIAVWFEDITKTGCVRKEELLPLSFQENKGFILSAFGETDFPKKYRCLVHQGLLKYGISSWTLKLQIKTHLSFKRPGFAKAFWWNPELVSVYFPLLQTMDL